MGQKVNPNGLRIGINKEWQSRWVALNQKQTAQWLVQDDKIRTSLIKNYSNALISNIEIERTQEKIEIFIYSAQPGLLFGKDNANLEKIKKEILLIVGKKTAVNVKIITIENPSFSARLIAREIADAIEKKISFRNAQKIAIKKALQSGVLGIKTRVSGRLGGVEMAREEGYSEGVVPLSTFRADIDYALEEAHTTYGLIGVKVWINRGEIFLKSKNRTRNNYQLESKKRRAPSSTNNEKPKQNFSEEKRTRKTDNSNKENSKVKKTFSKKPNDKVKE